jgi:hypothetical protein
MSNIKLVNLVLALNFAAIACFAAFLFILSDGFAVIDAGGSLFDTYYLVPHLPLRLLSIVPMVLVGAASALLWRNSRNQGASD